MDILGHLLTGGSMQANGWGPTDDRYYPPYDGGAMTSAGVRIDVEQAKMLSAWYRGRDILATVVAMLPLQILQRLPNDGGSQPAKGNPLYDVIHNKPNAQDSFQWRRQQMYAIIDHGSAFDWILPGRRGAVDQLEFIPPTRVTRRRIESGEHRGAILYDVRDPKTGRTTTHAQGEIFDRMGASEDGLKSQGILAAARSSLGTALATESYAAQIFGKGTMSGGVIKNPGLLNPDAARRMATSFVTKPGEWHLPKILEQGSEFTPNNMTPEDAQMLLSRKYNVDDIARWLGVPRMMLENNDPSFGNGEQFTQNFIDFNMGPWLALWEFAINTQLIAAPRTYFAQFTRQALVRGNFKERLEGLVLAAGGPIMTRNEARGVEDWKTLDKPEYDELIEQQNITGKPGPAPDDDDQPEPTKKAEPDPEQAPSRRKRGVRAETQDERVRAIVTESAARLVRKEITATQRSAVKFAADGPAFEAWATAFYEDHQPLVAQTMQVDPLTAQLYCDSQRDALIASGIGIIERWDTAYLVGVALDAPRPDPATVALLALASKPEARLTIAEGALQVHGAPTTVNQAPVTVHQAPVHVDAPVTVNHQASDPVAFTVEKTVTRGKDGIASVTERHEPHPRAKD